MDKVPQREKYWKELDTDEKIERLREYVRQIDRLRNRVFELERTMETHAHIDGTVYVPRIDSSGQVSPNTYNTLCKDCVDKVRI